MEEKVYKLGNYEFKTLREYRQAQEDLKKIKYITDELDIYNPEVALRLYTLMRSKKIKFKSEVGRSFFWCISDIVADSSQNMIREKRDGGTDAYEEPLLRTNWQKVTGIACIVIAVVCLGYYGLAELGDYMSARRLQNLQNNGNNAKNISYFIDTETEVKPLELTDLDLEIETEIKPPPVLEEYKDLYEQNPDLIGWLKIDGTNINYPVMQSSEDEYDFYLRHSFDKQDDRNGTLFLDARNHVLRRDTNLIIYGHNMKSGMMFGTLKDYLDADFRKEHSKIQFDTIYEKATYKVIGVCLGKVETQGETVFRYYNFLNVRNEMEFNDYMGRIQQMEVFGTAIDASYGDELLTLSTCNYYIEDGRMFIIAKKI